MNAAMQRMIDLEERIEVLEAALFGLLFGDAVHAEEEGRMPLAEMTGSLEYDLAHLPEGDMRKRRILTAALQLIADSRPTSHGDDAA